MGKKGNPLQCPLIDGNDNRFHFNPRLQVCDWPWNADCQKHTLKSATISWIPFGPKLNSSTIIVSAVPINSPSWTCKSDGRIHKIPHETLCDYYYKCYEGKIYPKPIKCERNLHFNPILRVCDYPENVDCGLPRTTTQSTSTVSPTTPTTKLTSPSTTPTLSSTTITKSSSPSTVSPTIASTTPTLPRSSTKPTPSITKSTLIPTSSTLPLTTRKTLPRWTCKSDGIVHKIPHDTMCDHYYNCYAGKVYPKPIKCERNLLFNPILRVCDYPENVNCNTPPSTPTQSTSTALPTIPTSGSTSTTATPTLPITTTESPSSTITTKSSSPSTITTESSSSSTITTESSSPVIFTVNYYDRIIYIINYYDIDYIINCSVNDINSAGINYTIDHDIEFNNDITTNKRNTALVDL
ncbi:hypothetical protein HN011_003211 [Eciton burchellii]|nr:hypothetical protein HN011_003211 [Eciton burchellii]